MWLVEERHEIIWFKIFTCQAIQCHLNWQTPAYLGGGIFCILGLKIAATLKTHHLGHPCIVLAGFAWVSIFIYFKFEGMIQFGKSLKRIAGCEKLWNVLDNCILYMTVYMWYELSRHVASLYFIIPMQQKGARCGARFNDSEAVVRAFFVWHFAVLFKPSRLPQGPKQCPCLPWVLTLSSCRDADQLATPTWRVPSGITKLHHTYAIPKPFPSTCI